MILNLTSCQNVVDGVSLKKKGSADQFLIEKKNPLVLPPDFDELPEPTNEAENSDEEEFDIKNILGQTSTKETSKNENKKTNSQSIKNTIMKKIK